MIAAEEDTDVKSLLIEAINLLFKTRGKSQIARDPIREIALYPYSLIRMLLGD